MVDLRANEACEVAKTLLKSVCRSSHRLSQLDDRSQNAKAMSMAANVTTISLMMAVPVLLGYFLDQLLGTVAVFIVLGVVAGLVCGVWQLFKLVQDQPPIDMSKVVEVEEDDDSLSDESQWEDES
jgi:F0F1-type ATP synthase assembly protein I